VSKIPACAYLQTVIAQCKKPTAQMAHLVFADTLANAQKPKEPFFSNARQKTTKK
jgi:hypothetical protein